MLLRAFAADMPKSVLRPGVHLVPGATLCITLQAPLAHCWKDVPSTQLKIPSLVQAPDCEPVVVPVGIPVEAGAEATRDDGREVLIIVATVAEVEVDELVATVAIVVRDILPEGSVEET